MREVNTIRLLISCCIIHAHASLFPILGWLRGGGREGDWGVGGVGAPHHVTFFLNMFHIPYMLPSLRGRAVSFIHPPYPTLDKKKNLKEVDRF